MDDILKQKTHEICKKVLLFSVMESPTLRKKLSFIEHAKLYNYVKEELTYEEGVEIVFEIGVRDYESSISSALKYGLAAVVGGVLAKGKGLKRIVMGATIGMVLNYLFRKHTDPCWQACYKQHPDKKEMCKYNCYIAGCDSVIRDIKAQRTRCNQTANPIKCEKGLNKALLKWQQRKENYREKLELAKERFAEKEAKSRLKAREKEIKSRGL